jgi:hypothetical protein
VEMGKWRWGSGDGEVEMGKWRWGSGDGEVEMGNTVNAPRKFPRARWGVLHSSYNGTLGGKQLMYPVTYQADYVSKEGRLITFFRIIAAIPLAIVSFFWGILTAFAILFAWVAMIFTAHYPKGLYSFVSSYQRYSARYLAFFYLITDRYPPFSGSEDEKYPIKVHFAGPLPKYSRLRAFFRPILSIPLYIFAIVLVYVGEIVAIGAWFVILFTGKIPKGMHSFLVLVFSYYTRAESYFYLISQTYPRLNDKDSGVTPETLQSAPSDPPYPTQPPPVQGQ